MSKTHICGSFDKEKQIEEMTESLCDIQCKGMKCNTCDRYGCEYRMLAEALYNAGYRKQSVGEWILTGTFKNIFPLPTANLHKACSVCNWSPPKYSDDYKEYNFCPNCGASMKGGTE